MGNVFSALECYANKSSPKKQPLNYFGYYNNFNSGNIKNLEQLKDQIITQLEIFKYSYQIYIKDHNEYHFPKNFKKEEIIHIINKMKELVNEEDKKYYDAILEIIDSKNVSYIYETKNKALSKGVNPNYVNQGFIIGDGGYATKISQNFGEEIQRRYHNNPNYQPQLYLNQSSPFSFPYKSKQRQMDKLIKELIEECNQLINSKSYNEGLVEKIKNNLKKFQDLKKQHPCYYYSEQNLNIHINKFKSVMKDSKYNDTNKYLLKEFYSVLKNISPNSFL
jgi:hypothetical protein